MITWRTGILSLFCATALVLTGCSGTAGGDPKQGASTGDSVADAPDAPDAPDAAEASDADTSTKESTLPADFPDDFPLPDGYMVVRATSGDVDLMGRYIELNIAVDGTVDDRIAYFDDALRGVFNDVQAHEAEGAFDSYSFTFTPGHGYEVGSLHIGENEGVLDRGDADSSHLPVLLYISYEERASN